LNALHLVTHNPPCCKHVISFELFAIHAPAFLLHYNEKKWGKGIK